MKRIIYFMLLITACLFITSCEKDVITSGAVSDDANATSEISPMKRERISLSRGWVLKNGKVVGSYMREFEDFPKEEYATCHSFDGSCFPDMLVVGSADIPDDVSEDEVDTIEKIYTMPFLTAFDKGDEAIKDFILNDFVKYCELPDEVITDFKNDKLTVKRFKNQYLIVNRGAKEPGDVPPYNWGN